MKKSKKNPSYTVEGTKVVTEKSKTLATLLRQMAKEETEPKFKEQFQAFGNGINDRALQIKILSAVNLAEGGGTQKSTQVTSALSGLKQNLGSLVNSLHAASLQTSIRQTTKQADAIRRLAEAFRQTNN